MSDAAFVDLVRRVDERIATVDGHGFRATPFSRQPALGERLGIDVWVKDETGNVGGSHKARHLMGILLYLAVTQRKTSRRWRSPVAATRRSPQPCSRAPLRVRCRSSSRRMPKQAVLDRLHVLGATVVSCPRAAGEPGDPCVRRFHEALRAGALPFCCQGNENGLAIDGGETLIHEMLGSGVPQIDELVVQVGGGALGSACMQALARAVAAGLLPRAPRVHTVQTQGAAPLRRAWTLLQQQGGGTRDGFEAALRHAVMHRSSFMWPWEEVPHSVAERHPRRRDLRLGRLVARHGRDGRHERWSSTSRRSAMRIGVARETTGIAVSPTGSAGLAGVLQLQRDGVIADGARVAVLFSGVQR